MTARSLRSEAGPEGALIPSAPRTQETPATIDFYRLLDTLIQDAPHLVRTRALLPAFDWRKATPDQAERLLARLADSDMKIPAWLAKELLTAGHKVPPSAVASVSPGLQALASLSCAAGDRNVETISRHILDISQFREMEDWVASSLVARLVALGQTSLACRVAWNQFHTSPGAMRQVRRYDQDEMKALPPVRLRLTGAVTTHDLASALKPAFAAAGWRAEVSEAGFGSVISELLTPHDETDALAIMLSREIVACESWRHGAEEARRLIDVQIEALIGAMRSFCGASQAPLLVNTLPASTLPAAGHIDTHHPTGEAAIVAEVNRRLFELAAQTASIHLVDADVALAHLAPNERRDPKLWYFGRMAYSDAAIRGLARGFAKVWQSLRRGGAKVLAVDFDNTLWGGIYGDDGLDGLQCGDDFPGNAFKALQLECLRLKSQGMLLAGLSKNNADAAEVFARHPGMALTRDDFVACAINWEPKPDNIRRVAAELGLGLESFVFLDDSPHEREAMRRMCPGVIVPEMPADPAFRPQWLRSLSCTWPLRLTEEDARRSDMYVAERQGRELREKSRSYGEYLSELQQTLVVSPVKPETLSRAAQLHQRTNQFNLTNLRLGEGDLSVFMSDDPKRTALIGRVNDRFGDYGIVLAACAEIEGKQARIVSFVMSCRVIGRQLEAAFLEALISRLASLGVEHVEGRYCPAPKNGMVREFYASMGFAAAGWDGDAELWSLPIRQGAVAAPRPVTIEWKET